MLAVLAGMPDLVQQHLLDALYSNERATRFKARDLSAKIFESPDFLSLFEVLAALAKHQKRHAPVMAAAKVPEIG